MIYHFFKNKIDARRCIKKCTICSQGMDPRIVKKREQISRIGLEFKVPADTGLEDGRLYVAYV